MLESADCAARRERTSAPPIVLWTRKETVGQKWSRNQTEEVFVLEIKICSLQTVPAASCSTTKQRFVPSNGDQLPVQMAITANVGLGGCASPQLLTL